TDTLHLPCAFTTMRCRPLRLPPFPYTTLFRSIAISSVCFNHIPGINPNSINTLLVEKITQNSCRGNFSVRHNLIIYKVVVRRFRSEEHTSELQSRENLVCRLLLEKKNKKTITE